MSEAMLGRLVSVWVVCFAVAATKPVALSLRHFPLLQLDFLLLRNKKAVLSNSTEGNFGSQQVFLPWL